MTFNQGSWGGPPPPPVGPPYGGGYGQRPAQTESMATVSLVCGLASLPGMLCCSIFGLPLSIAAVITGFVAISNIDKRPDELTGKGLAYAGIITGAVGIMLLVLLFAIGVGGALIEHLGK
jgi:hypothetical protein